MRTELRIDVVAPCPGQGKSQQGPLCAGIAGNGSETKPGVWVGGEGVWGKELMKGEVFLAFVCVCMLVCE